MAQNNTPVKALVLAGGRPRQLSGGRLAGADRAGLAAPDHYGTSVGSLNGAMFALDLYETARDMC